MLESTILLSSQLANQLYSNDQSPKYYRHYPRLFASYFSAIEKNKIEKLCDAGYLYYHSVLLIDRVIDDKGFSSIPNSIVLQEETIKILTTLFGEESNFWNLWNVRRQDIDFIKPKLLEPYRSKTMTTGLVLNAMIQY